MICLELYPPVNANELFNKEAAKHSLGMGKNKIINFPKELVKGPEQIAAINSTTQTTYLIGEAGSGKTTVLLALLYKFTRKHVKPKKLR